MDIKVYFFEEKDGWFVLIPMISQAVRATTKEEAISKTTLCLVNHCKWYQVMIDSNRNSIDKYGDREELTFNLATGQLRQSLSQRLWYYLRWMF